MERIGASGRVGLHVSTTAVPYPPPTAAPLRKPTPPKIGFLYGSRRVIRFSHHLSRPPLGASLSHLPAACPPGGPLLSKTPHCNVDHIRPPGRVSARPGRVPCTYGTRRACPHVVASRLSVARARAAAGQLGHPAPTAPHRLTPCAALGTL